MTDYAHLDTHPMFLRNAAHLVSLSIWPVKRVLVMVGIRAIILMGTINYEIKLCVTQASRVLMSD